MTPFIALDDLEELAEGQDCPFCGHDPYHYVDVGVGMVPAAITCCDLGIGLFQYRDEQLVRVAETLRMISQELLARRRFEVMARLAVQAIDACAAISTPSPVVAKEGEA